MISTTALQKRIDRLELRPTTEPDLVEKALAALEDKDLELLQEHAVLRESGFDEEQTVSMMGDRYKQAQKSVARFQECYAKLESARYGSPSLRGKANANAVSVSVHGL